MLYFGNCIVGNNTAILLSVFAKVALNINIQSYEIIAIGVWFNEVSNKRVSCADLR